MKTRIIIDSSADLKPSVREKCTVIPLTLRFGEEEFLDGVNIDHKTFYEKLAKCETLPTTSQASPDTFDRYFRQVVEAGDQAVVICLSSKLSGTCQSAAIAAMEYPGRIYVVDGMTVTIGTGVLAELAVSLAETGADAETIAETLTRERERVRIVAILDTLEYLKKGGRISKTVAFAGELLSIKPVVGVQEGQAVLLGKARARQANGVHLQQIEKAGGVDASMPVLLGYTGVDDTLMHRYVEDNAQLWQELGEIPAHASVGSVIGTHVGPGAVAVAFFKK